MKYRQEKTQQRRTASRPRCRPAARRCWKKNAFSLIELLVVISIIALLASILLPSLCKAKELAKQAVCASRSRNFGTALEYYLDEYNSVLPSAEPRNQEPVSPLHWFMNEAFVKHVGVELSYDEQSELIGPKGETSGLTCPGHDTPTITRPRDGEPSVEHEYGLSYGMNGTFGLGGRPDQTEYRKRMEFKHPSDSCALADCWGTSLGPGVVFYHACVKENLVFRHLGTANIVFLDSHVEYREPEDVPMGFAKRYDPFWSAKKP